VALFVRGEDRGAWLVDTAKRMSYELGACYRQALRIAAARDTPLSVMTG
jgi:hypothetical protein